MFARVNCGTPPRTRRLRHCHGFVEKPKSVLFDEEIEEAIAEARTICAQKGATSRECAVAWDIVEEIQAEASHQRSMKLDKTAFDEYCEENPEAAEARMYES